MEEIIEIRYADSEDDFLYREGVNRGWVLSFAKIDKNFYIDSNERSLLNLLKQYAQGSKKCFPGRDTLCEELGGWSTGRLTESIKEAERLKLIKTVKEKGKNTIYYLLELHKCPVIAHSEFVHSIKKKYVKQGLADKYKEAHKKYRQSELIKEVFSSDNPLQFRQQISDFFSSYIEGKNESAPTPKPKTPNPFYGNLPPTDAESVKDPEENNKKKPKSKNPDEVEIGEWNTHHFLAFFKLKFTEKMNAAYPTNLKEDLGAMKHVLSQTSDNEKVRKLIELYFENFNGTVHSVKNFSSSFVQQKLIFILNSGSSTSYKKNSGKAQPQSDEMKDWASRLDEWED
ncbi:hypothetical protein [Peribacillus frigoritolerans]|uniref:Helix-turn-helix domain-containing protein n=1 Tax=Peribacillus castrilensis TaxID=2897690 RepID=A0AAW9NKQ4_9BACI|nr:hypothetical protein [Peribacillus castrilensis]